MNVNQTERRVGLKNWVCLGAFVQSPGMILDKSEIAKFIIANDIAIDWSHMIHRLVKEGFIEQIDRSTRYRLTEYGATVRGRREARQGECFLRLDGGR